MKRDNNQDYWQEEVFWGTCIAAVIVVLGMALAYSVWGA
jgi:anti-sigma-K factor RskA